MKGKELTREKILNAIESALKPLDFVYGMWQCGSVAFGRVDDWSDIDVVVDVEDNRVMEIFNYTDRVLEKLSPIEKSFESSQPMSPGAYQKVYKLKDTSEFLIIEICALKHSSPHKFLEKEIHNEVFMHFDKRNVTKVKPIDKEKFAQKLEARIEQLENLFNIYQCLIKKELNRDNYIEALAFYNSFSINPLLELLRIKYSPFRYNFRTRYVYYDFPEDVVNKLEDLYFVKNGEDLKSKHKKVIVWFNNIYEELKKLNIKEIIN